MFIDIAGDLINTEHVVQLNRANLMELVSGSVIPVSQKDADNFRKYFENINKPAVALPVEAKTK